MPAQELDAAAPSLVDPAPHRPAPTDERDRRRRWVIALVVVLVLARVVSIAVLLGTGIDSEHSILGGDARRYRAILAEDGTPYRDHDVEYPPIALGAMALLDRGELFDLQVRLAISQLLLELAITALLAAGWGRRTAVMYLVLGTPMIFFPFPYARLDMLSVFLAVLALSLYRRHHDRTGGALLGVAVFAKIWPLAVAPIFLVERRYKALAAWVVAGAVGTLAWVAWAGTAGIEQVVTLRGSKGWQVESLVGLPLHMRDPSASIVEQGAWRTAVEVPGALKVLLPALGIATIAATWWLASRRHRTELPAEDPARDDLVLYGWAPMASVLALLVFSTIVSPQYLLWIVPFAAVAAARGDRTLGLLFFATVALTTWGLGTIVAQVRGEWWSTVPLLVRNGLLVAMLVLCLARLARGLTAADSPTASLSA